MDVVGPLRGPATQPCAAHGMNIQPLLDYIFPFKELSFYVRTKKGTRISLFSRVLHVGPGR